MIEPRPEVMLNLWYVYDDDGLIYSLRILPYIRRGTEEDDLSLLRERAEIDYLIAKPYPIPERFSTTFIEGKDKKTLPVAIKSAYPTPNDCMVLFENAIEDVEANFPAQSNIRIPQDPLVCITPLKGDDKGSICPNFSRTQEI